MYLLVLQIIFTCVLGGEVLGERGLFFKSVSCITLCNLHVPRVSSEPVGRPARSLQGEMISQEKEEKILALRPRAATLATVCHLWLKFVPGCSYQHGLIMSDYFGEEGSCY